MNSTRTLTIGAVIILVIILLNLDGPARLKKAGSLKPGAGPAATAPAGVTNEAAQTTQVPASSAQGTAEVAPGTDLAASEGPRQEPTEPGELPALVPVPAVPVSSPEPEGAPLPPGAIDAVREATRQVIAGGPANARAAIEFSDQLTKTRLYDDERQVVARIQSENVRSLVVAMEKMPDSPGKRQYARYIFDELRSDPATGIRDIRQALSVLPQDQFPLSHAAGAEVLQALEAARGDGR